MERDPTQRFTDRVDDYARYRPDYPAALYDLLVNEHGLDRRHTIADLGAGTGLLAQLFLEQGHRVIGIEPNEAMRRMGERALAGFAGYRAVAATAEATTLPSGSIDVVTAGQSFHWFNPDRARVECLRILTPIGFAVLVWNTWDHATSDFMKGYASIVTRNRESTDHAGRRRVVGVSRFFGGGCLEHSLEHGQRFDREGLRGRLLSSSYAPKPGDPRHQPMVEELDRLFDAYADAAGTVAFELRTQVFVGRPEA